MRIVNETPFVAGNTIAFRQDGRELLVVVAKGTFVLVDPLSRDGQPRVADEQVPLLMADEFGKDPAKNAPILENDFAPTKPECDVLLAGCAYAPHGAPTRVLGVGLRVGPISKSFHVTGFRSWRAVLGVLAAGDPEPTVQQPISYDVAFGGTEADPKKPDKIETFLENPVGRGFRKHHIDLWGQPMPVTEGLSDPIRDPKKHYRPMAFGPLGRNWKPRMDYVGTYDQKWMDEVAPMLPADFNPLHFQAAPPDQRMPYPRGGEPIRLMNLVPPTLSPDARAQSSLPSVRLAMVFVPRIGEPVWVDANLDTIVIQPDQNRFTCAWRTSHATIRDASEISQVVVCLRGTQSETRTRAHLGGKTYYQGLGALAKGRKGGAK
jgi:hypothetical protein